MTQRRLGGDLRRTQRRLGTQGGLRGTQGGLRGTRGGLGEAELCSWLHAARKWGAGGRLFCD